MTDTSVPSDSGAAARARLVRSAVGMFELIPYWLVALVARLSIAGVFWQSGQTKVMGWQLSDSAVTLFRHEYNLPLIDPVIAAYFAAFAEHFFSILLAIGLATRFSALAFLLMTLVIQIFVYPDAWPTHGTWAACLLLLMSRGPGCVSFDHLVAQHYRR